MQAQASLMNSTNYTKAHEAKNRGQHIQAVEYLKMAAIDLGLSLDWSLGLDWTGDAIADWDNNIAAVDAAWERKDSPWKLLHEDQPLYGGESYLGFKDREGCLIFHEGAWGGDDWALADTQRNVFGYVYPADLPVDIHWCYTSEFASEIEARQSLKSLLGVS